MSVAPLLPVAREDKFFLLFEGLGAPVTALWAMRFAGAEVDRDKLRAATAHALERHPKALSRLVRNPQSLPRKRYREVLAWEPFPSSIDGVCRFHEARPATDGASPKLEPFLEIMNAPMDSGVGPLVEIHWFPHAAATGTLVFRFHHAFADGHGSLLFLRDLLSHYNGTPAEPAPDYARPPAPLVPGTRMDKLKLFWRLLTFHFRRS